MPLRERSAWLALAPDSITFHGLYALPAQGPMSLPQTLFLFTAKGHIANMKHEKVPGM